MFDPLDVGVGLLPGESTETLEAEDRLSFELTSLAEAEVWSPPDRHVLCDDLEQIPPGPYLAVVLSAVDVDRLNGHDAVRLMQAEARLASHHEAGKFRAMAGVAFSPPSDPDSGVLRSSEEVEYAEVEVAAALTLTRRASVDQVSRAVLLTGRLQRVWDELWAGRIDGPRVKVFDDYLGHLPGDTVDTVLDEILGLASGLTTGQLRRRLAKLVMAADPDGEKSSYKQGLADRRVVVGSNPDHTANFSVYSGCPEKVVAARDNVERLARALKTEQEQRSLEQLRSDVSLDLLAGRFHPADTPASGGGRANVTIPFETLARLSDQPGELDGYGPVLAEIARKTVVDNIDGEWTFTVTDNGVPVATGTLSRRPTRAQKRKVRADYPTCVMVGCGQPAYQCDLDHCRPHSQGGPTSNDNLEPLCRYHHMAKHRTPWKLKRLPNGDHQWTSPLGHTYTRKRDPPH
jgi:hypothetical protein